MTAAEASALKEDRFYTSDVLARLEPLPDFLQKKEQWLAAAVAQLALRGCGREEISYLVNLPEEVLNEDLEGQEGTCLLDLDFLPIGAGCLIQGSVSAAHLNGLSCCLLRPLRETHALVAAEGTDLGEGTGVPVLLARKNLIFQKKAATFSPEEEVPDPAQLLGATALPEDLCNEEARRWLGGLVGRLLLRSCGREEVSFGAPALPSSVAAEHLGMMLQDLAFCPVGAMVRVEGSKSMERLNGLQGALSESCPSYATHAKLSLPGEGEILIHRKNLRLVAYGGLKTVLKEPRTAAPGPGCAWFSCCSASFAQKQSIKAPASLADDLRHLAELKTAGALSDGEFQAAKRKLLS
ncbi:unnamed protein product [Effrenium voratum]|uniref:SHOCT domain-containing protein n=1 Tax=Effrenium voratum TaxID=2562239 RepID=A0AA36I5A6_9DINO|nr:unnamed protein product [Effrenium voratum]